MTQISFDINAPLRPIKIKHIAAPWLTQEIKTHDSAEYSKALVQKILLMKLITVQYFVLIQ